MSSPNLFWNKVFASVLVAGIVAMLAGFLADALIHSETLEQNAVAIEGVEGGGESGSGVAAKPKLPEPVLGLLAAADPVRGEKLFKACASCHSPDKDGGNRVGPNLWGVVGRDKGSVSGFSYSASLSEKEGNWTYADLNHFLWKPKAYVSGTKMNFVGLKKPEDRAAVIAYLRGMSDSPLPLPTEGEIAAEVAALDPDSVVVDSPAPTPESVPAPEESVPMPMPMEAPSIEPQAGGDAPKDFLEDFDLPLPVAPAP